MNGASRLRHITDVRRFESERVAEQQATNGIVRGKSLTVSEDGFGQVNLNVSFPVTFVEEPVFSYGYALEEGEYVQGVVPACTAVVVAWDKRTLTDDRVYWVGAQIGVRIEGWPGLLLWVHHTFTGVSLQNPVAGNGSMSETL